MLWFLGLATTMNLCNASKVRCILVGKMPTNIHVSQLDAETNIEIANKQNPNENIVSSKSAMC